MATTGTAAGTQAAPVRGTMTVAQGTALTVGAVLGTGVISMPALAAGIAGPASLLAWLALVLLSVPLALTFAALGARHPDGGGVSTYVRLAFGSRAAAAVGWCCYFAVPLGAPAASAFAGGYVADVLGGGRRTVLSTFVLIMAVVFAMNWFGLRVSGRVQLVLAGTLAVLLLAAVVTAMPHARLANLTRFAPHGWVAVGSAAAVLVWGFAGWEAVTSLSADYRHPRRDVPRATVAAVIIVAVLYLAVAATSVLVLGPTVGSSQAPLADLLAVGVGGPVRALTAIVAVLLTLGAVNAYLAGASRLGAALARDGALPVRIVGTHRTSLVFVTVGGLAAAFLPFTLHTSMLLVTGCFTLVYVLGTAAALRLLPAGWSRRGAAVAFVAVAALMVLTGPPALWSLAVAAGAVAYQTLAARRSRSPKRLSPSSIVAGSSAPNPNTKPVCAAES
jgi:amino acid efflux transporter